MNHCLIEMLTFLLLPLLTNNNSGVASIVYLVIETPNKTVLLYDRNRKGLMVSDASFTANILGLNSDPKPVTSQIVQLLPLPVLEHILMFLPDSSVAIAKQVCLAWNEIGKGSPNLWRGLCRRKCWPYSCEASIRDQYIQHYTVLRDIRGIQLGLHALLTKKSTEEREMTYQAFYARQGAPQSPNKCVAVKIWDANRVLAAYSNDCTLRLFQAVCRDGSSEMFCREVICRSIDPFKNTKKKTCFLLDVGLDSDVVGALLSVTDETNDKSPHLLVCLSRDDLLQGEEEDTGNPEQGNGSMHVIDVEKAVLDYILSRDDQWLLPLHDFLLMGGSEDEIEIIPSASIAGDGRGRFMLEVSISLPHVGDNDDAGDHGGNILLHRQLFLFSSSVGMVLWMGDSNPSSELLRPAEEDMTLISEELACTVVCCCHTFAPALKICEIDSSGHVEGTQEMPRDERLFEEGWSERVDGNRALAINSTDIVVGDTLSKQMEDNGERIFQSVLTFYPRGSANENASGGLDHFRLAFEGCSLDSMFCLRDEYLCCLVRFYSETGFIVNDGGGGHWGGENRATKVYCIIVHTPTRFELERICLYEDHGNNKLCFAGNVNGGTVCCAFSSKGIIMTGNDIRKLPSTISDDSFIVLDNSTKISKKKGKKRLSKGKGKKDAFARGMSLRG